MVSQADLDRQRQGDLEVIAALKRAGSNLSKPHSIEHHFICPTREIANRIRAWGTGQGLVVSEVNEGEYSGRRYYYFDCIRSTTPMIDAIFADTSRFLALAAEFGAEYDGWGCQVVK